MSRRPDITFCLVGLLLLAAPGTSAQSPVELSSLLTLKNMYPSLGSLWQMSQSPCTWKGIECSDAAHAPVYIKSLSFGSWFGHPFTNFGAANLRFPNTTSLSLAAVNMSEPLGHSLLLGLPQLQQLRLESLEWSSLDPAFGNLTKLQSVTFWSLTRLYHMPYVMSKYLQSFTIYGLYSAGPMYENQFTGNSEIKYMMLSGVSKISKSVGGLRKLERLDIDLSFTNPLESHVFDTCDSLVYLRLTGNGVYSLPSSIANCKKLDSIKLWFTPMNAPNALPDMSSTSLMSLSITQTNLAEVPLSLCNCAKLSELEIGGDMHRPTFSSLPSCLAKLPLSTLRIFGAQLKAFPVEIIEGLSPMLDTLDLSSNQIADFPTNYLLRKLTSLRSLRLSKNQFNNNQLSEEVFGGDPLPLFDNMDISGCGFTGAWPSNSSLLSQLQWLNANDNLFTSLPDNFLSNSLFWSAHINFNNNMIRGSIAPILEANPNPKNEYVQLHLNNNHLDLCPPPSMIKFKNFNGDFGLNNLCNATKDCIDFWTSTRCIIYPALPCA